MKWINQVAKYHEDYLRMVRSFGEEFMAEDIVQEMYIKIMKHGDPERLVNDKGDVNMSYIFLIIRCIVYDLQKEQKKLQKVSDEVLKNMGVEYDYISKGEAEYELEIKINEEMDTWEYFDRRLFQLYRDSGMSMRKIASETRISTKTIFYSIKKSKERLREKCAEDYEDYINEDYELI